MATATRRPGVGQLAGLVRDALDRHPAVGVAIGVVRDGRLEHFHGRGFADLDAGAPVTEETVFRIASVTKLFTAIAVMQLSERGLVNLDAPAGDYLRAYRLVPDPPGMAPPVLRDLLTHTSGIPDVIRLGDLLHPSWGSFAARPAVYSVRVGEPLPSLAEYYRGALRYVVPPGTRFAYSNHAFATLGQLVEEVSGLALDRYLRERIFEPLGMADTDLARADRLLPRLATGYELRRGGARPVPERTWISLGGGGIYSTTRDMARFVAALLGGGEGVLGPETLAMMYEPHFRPDPRVPGMGLAFFRSEIAGHLVVGHDGRLPGFNSDLQLVPDAGIGVIGLTNGSPGATTWLPAEVNGLLSRLLGIAETHELRQFTPHPEVWTDVRGRYHLPERVSDLRGRLMLGGGVDLFVRQGRLLARLRLPLPSLYRGLPLEAASATDPHLFRIDLTRFGMPIVTVAFRPRHAVDGRALHTDLACISLYERPATRRRWLRPALLFALGTAALALLRRRRR